MHLFADSELQRTDYDIDVRARMVEVPYDIAVKLMRIWLHQGYEAVFPFLY